MGRKLKPRILVNCLGCAKPMVVADYSYYRKKFCSQKCAWNNRPSKLIGQPPKRQRTKTNNNIQLKYAPDIIPPYKFVSSPPTLPDYKHPIKIVPLIPKIAVSDHGDVFILDDGEWRPKTSRIRNNGYVYIVCMSNGVRKNYPVHQLVLNAFVGPRPYGHFCLHANGIRNDNRLANLRYGTPSENAQDAINHGTHPSLHQTGKQRTKFNHITINYMRRLLSSGKDYHEIADHFNISRLYCYQLINGSRPPKISTSMTA